MPDIHSKATAQPQPSITAPSAPAKPLMPAPVEPLLVSLRQAARLLGCDRYATLRPLIQRGLIKVVSLAGRPKIPMTEIRRIAEQGTGPLEPITPRRRSQPRERVPDDLAARLKARGL